MSVQQGLPTFTSAKRKRSLQNADTLNLLPSQTVTCSNDCWPLKLTAIESVDSAAALKVLQSDVRIDLLVTDVALPGGMNGR